MLKAIKSPPFLVFLMLQAGCAGKQSTLHTPSSLTVDEWCSNIERLGDSSWKCVFPPGRFKPGDFGPEGSLSENSLANVLPSAKPEIRNAGDRIGLTASATTSLQAGATLNLNKIANWLPDATLGTNTDSEVEITFEIVTPTYIMYNSLADALFSALSRQNEALLRSQRVLCSTGTRIVLGGLVGKLATKIRIKSSGGNGGKLGWREVNAAGTKSEKADGSIEFAGASPITFKYDAQDAHDFMMRNQLCPAMKVSQEGTIRIQLPTHKAWSSTDGAVTIALDSTSIGIVHQNSAVNFRVSVAGFPDRAVSEAPVGFRVVHGNYQIIVEDIVPAGASFFISRVTTADAGIPVEGIPRQDQFNPFAKSAVAKSSAPKIKVCLSTALAAKGFPNKLVDDGILAVDNDESPGVGRVRRSWYKFSVHEDTGLVEVAWAVASRPTNAPDAPFVQTRDDGWEVNPKHRGEMAELLMRCASRPG